MRARPRNGRVVESSVNVEPFDKRAATDVATTLSTLPANEFADNAKPEETGLDSPENTVTVSLRNGKQYRILIGKKKDDDNTYVKMADKPQVFLIRKYQANRSTNVPSTSATRPSATWPRTRSPRSRWRATRTPLC